MNHNKNYNILIVEDEFINAKFIEQVIEELGHNVIANVDNAEKAVAVITNNLVDFVFMDINLESEIDGIACAKLLNIEKNIAIIYMTAISDTLTIESASKTNIFGYLIKPFNAKDIESALSVAIARFLALKQLTENKSKSTSIHLGNGYSYIFISKTLTKENHPISLTQRESSILHFLALHINQNISYSSLQQYVWRDKEISLSTVRDTILRLRKKAPLLPIENLVGIGYCLKNV